MNIAKTIELNLRGGQHLTLDMSSDLLDKIKEAFGLASDADITERHVKYYLTSSMKNALEIE